MTPNQPSSCPATKLIQQIDIDFILRATGLGVRELDPKTNLVTLDDRCRALFGLEQGYQWPYEHTMHPVHPQDAARVHTAVQQALDPQSAGLYDISYRTVDARDGRLRWVHVYGRSYIAETGDVVRLAGVVQDITQQIASEESQRQVLDLFEQSPVGIAIISPDNLTIRMANPFYSYLVGRAPEQIVGKPLLEALPELDRQGFDDLLREVLATGVPFVANEVAVAIVRNEALETIYVDLTYQPRYDTTGGISGILVVATDVTAQVLSRQRVEESEARFRSLIEEAPVSTCLFVGPELIIDVINEVMLGYWGRDRSVIGKPLAEALPELKGQPHLQILNEVYRTGRTYEARQVRADLMVEGVLKTFYFDLIHKPLLESRGTGICHHGHVDTMWSHRCCPASAWRKVKPGFGR